MKLIFYTLTIALFLTGINSVGKCNNSTNDISKIQDVTKIINQLNSRSDSIVLVASHRGDWRNAPENSIQAIKNCIKMGVDIVEIDVRMTKDSALILMHDATIDRTTTGKGKVTDWCLDSLKILNLKNGCGIATHSRIPTFKEAMETAKGQIMVNIDKASEYMDKVYEILVETGTVDQAILKGSDDIEKVRKKYGSMLDKIIYMPIIKEETPMLSGLVDDYITEYHPVAFEVIYNRDDSPMFDMIKTIKDKNTHIWVNTLWESLCGEHTDDRAVDDPDGSWGWVIKHGASIIQTDRPEELLKYLKNKNLHH